MRPQLAHTLAYLAGSAARRLLAALRGPREPEPGSPARIVFWSSSNGYAIPEDHRWDEHTEDAEGPGR